MKNQNPKALLYPDHPKPITRRQFLAQGLIDAAAYVMLPSVLHYVMNPLEARAEGCPAPGTFNGLPFLVFDCAGGAALSGNWLVGKQGGPTDFLSAYDKMGVPTPPQNGEPIDSQFGVPMFTNLSQVRAGIVNNTSPEAQARLRMGTICTASQDDSTNNLLSPLILVSQSGFLGRHVTTAVGQRGSLSGGSSRGPVADPSMKPLTVNSVDGFLGALSYGPALDNLALSQKSALAKALQSLSSTQAEKLAAMDLGAQLRTMANCGFLKNSDYVDSAAARIELDPRQDANASAVYGLTPASTGGTTAAPAIVYNVLKQNTGPGAITIGGCDYHDGTQTTGDAKDLEIGTQIGRAVELAHRMGKPLMFCVFTDGSVYSDIGTRVWRGDAGSQSLIVVGYYNPAGAPNMRTLQIGHYKEGQGVERKTYLGNDPKKAAFAVFANYLSAQGRINQFANQVSTNDFDPTQIDLSLIFG